MEVQETLDLGGGRTGWCVENLLHAIRDSAVDLEGRVEVVTGEIVVVEIEEVLIVGNGVMHGVEEGFIRLHVLDPAIDLCGIETDKAKALLERRFDDLAAIEFAYV